MKKNMMMRVASALLVAVLLSTCAISGTFAKYVTTASGTDSARVAKWGITMKDTGAGFMANYNDTVIAGDGTATVVAPGTTHTTQYVVSGAPETAYKITFVGTQYTKDVYLGDGTYTYTGTNVEYEGMNATLGGIVGPYYPLEWKITLDTDDGDVKDNGWEKNVARTFATLNAAMTELAKAEITYAANETCDLQVHITWEWDYDKDNAGSITDNTYESNDVYDTILGDLAAKVAGETTDLNVSASADFSLNVEFTVKMTATQID